ncbi:PknH-like extracellular domain-containing protein [Thermomonospora echinospora]|uniref:PknH-like extracellular domain-containing protein n=1 Tax=Thermomonospora echinospora TaxID=1992 RepID=A0A1H5VCI1_9ACTN|nr:PknH-like extracellular domain-containing protein [Thermomonospora echinospora]
MWVALAVAVGYLVLSVVSVTGAVRILTRDPTAAELRRAADAEVARRWRAWPAGRIFPERLTYLPGTEEVEYATRAGIAPETDCAGSVDAATATVLQRHGCRAVLRATYADQLEGVVVTVGVVVFPDQQAAYQARQEIPGSPTALRAAAFPGTVAARFDDAARQSGTAERGGPYLVLTTAGQSDGRPATAVAGKQRPDDLFGLVPQLGHTIAQTLSTRALPDCTSADWQC